MWEGKDNGKDVVYRPSTMQSVDHWIKTANKEKHCTQLSQNYERAKLPSKRVTLPSF